MAVKHVKDQVLSVDKIYDSPIEMKWCNTGAFHAIKKKKSQLDYYIENNASPEVLKLISGESRQFGANVENIIREMFNIGPPTSTEHDGIFEGKKIEIKSGRYLKCSDKCMWQHLEPGHDYEYVIVCFVDFHDLRCWIISKSILMGLRETKVVRKQGTEGYLTHKKDILPYLTPIYTANDIRSYIASTI
jgi:hypothetical protein